MADPPPLYPPRPAAPTLPGQSPAPPFSQGAVGSVASSAKTPFFRLPAGTPPAPTDTLNPRVYVGLPKPVPKHLNQPLWWQRYAQVAGVVLSCGVGVYTVFFTEFGSGEHPNALDPLRKWFAPFKARFIEPSGADRRRLDPSYDVSLAGSKASRAFSRPGPVAASVNSLAPTKAASEEDKARRELPKDAMDRWFGPRRSDAAQGGQPTLQTVVNSGESSAEREVRTARAQEEAAALKDLESMLEGKKPYSAVSPGSASDSKSLQGNGCMIM